MADDRRQVLVTGGAGYIGSMLTGMLLRRGDGVTVVDDLLFGGESLLPHLQAPGFRFCKGNVCDPKLMRAAAGGIAIGAAAPVHYDWIVHLAAIVGFPACQAVGRDVAWRFNVDATKRMFELAEASGAERFLLASTYSNYGIADDGKPVTEESPLNPQSLYAETKIASETFLRDQARGSRCAPIIPRFATLFGVSPRTRFDLIVNQFVLEAMTKRRLVIYQRGYARSFVHVRDVCRGVRMLLDAPLETVRGQLFNLGGDAGNYTKDEIVDLVQKHVAGTEVEYKDLSFGGDMRDIRVSFAKIRETLGFAPEVSLEEGVCEVRDAIETGLIKEPHHGRYRNAEFIVQ